MFFTLLSARFLLGEPSLLELPFLFLAMSGRGSIEPKYITGHHLSLEAKRFL
jgi:hypothetical protein